MSFVNSKPFQQLKRECCFLLLYENYLNFYFFNFRFNHFYASEFEKMSTIVKKAN